MVTLPSPGWTNRDLKARYDVDGRYWLGLEATTWVLAARRMLPMCDRDEAQKTYDWTRTSSSVGKRLPPAEMTGGRGPLIHPTEAEDGVLLSWLNKGGDAIRLVAQMAFADQWLQVHEGRTGAPSAWHKVDRHWAGLVLMYAGEVFSGADLARDIKGMWDMGSLPVVMP